MAVIPTAFLDLSVEPQAGVMGPEGLPLRLISTSQSSSKEASEDDASSTSENIAPLGTAPELLL